MCVYVRCECVYVCENVCHAAATWFEYVYVLVSVYVYASSCNDVL